MPGMGGGMNRGGAMMPGMGQQGVSVGHIPAGEKIVEP